MPTLPTVSLAALRERMAAEQRDNRVLVAAAAAVLALLALLVWFLRPGDDETSLATSPRRPAAAPPGPVVTPSETPSAVPPVVGQGGRDPFLSLLPADAAEGAGGAGGAEGAAVPSAPLPGSVANPPGPPPIPVPVPAPAPPVAPPQPPPTTAPRPDPAPPRPGRPWPPKPTTSAKIKSSFQVAWTLLDNTRKEWPQTCRDIRPDYQIRMLNNRNAITSLGSLDAGRMRDREVKDGFLSFTCDFRYTVALPAGSPVVTVWVGSPDSRGDFDRETVSASRARTTGKGPRLSLPS